MESTYDLIWSLLVFVLGMYIMLQYLFCKVKKLTTYTQLSDKYIRRLKAVAKLKGCDLSDVGDDREDIQ